MYAPPLEVRHVEGVRFISGKAESARSPFGATALCSGPCEHWEIEGFFKIRATELLKTRIIAHDQSLAEGPARAH